MSIERIGDSTLLLRLILDDKMEHWSRESVLLRHFLLFLHYDIHNKYDCISTKISFVTFTSLVLISVSSLLLMWLPRLQSNRKKAVFSFVFDREDNNYPKNIKILVMKNENAHYIPFLTIFNNSFLIKK